MNTARCIMYLRERNFGLFSGFVTIMGFFLEFVHFSRWSLCAPRFEIQDVQRNPVLLVEGPICLCRCWNDIEFKVCLLHYLFYSVSLLTYFFFISKWKLSQLKNTCSKSAIKTLEQSHVGQAFCSLWNFILKVASHHECRN